MRRFPLLATVVPVLLLAGTVFAQNSRYPSLSDVKPMYKAGPTHPELAPAQPAASVLPQWNGSFTDLTKKKITYTMVGANPATSNTTTTIPVYIIPIKMVYGANNGSHTFNPKTAKASNGKTVLANLIASPVFDPSVNFTQGGTNLGTTQYIDAFQRGNFWKFVKTHTKYHTLLAAPKVLALQTITVTPAQGAVFLNPWGNGTTDIVGTMDIFAFDAKLQTFMAKFTQINPGVLPVFVTYDVYLTEGGGCCIGGYHGANGAQPGGQTYSHASYIIPAGSFAQDVSALSHEIGEWLDDPFVDNMVNCNDNSAMEDGDPLENNANFGAFPYTLNNFTYNLQSLVFIGYFGAPKATSVHSWLSFQHDQLKVCPGQ